MPMARSPAGPRVCTTASSATSATATSDGWVAMHLSLVPSMAWPRLKPSRAAQPLPGSRLLHGEAASRK